MFVSFILLLTIKVARCSFQNVSIQDEINCTNCTEHRNKDSFRTGRHFSFGNQTQTQRSQSSEESETIGNRVYERGVHLKREKTATVRETNGPDQSRAWKFNQKEYQNRTKTYLRSTPDKSPWAMIVVVPSTEQIHGFLCHGTLVKAEWVMSAAACLKKKNAKLDTKNSIKVYGGVTYQLDAIHMRFNPGVEQMRTVDMWYFRPEDDSFMKSLYTLAFLNVDHPFKVTKYVKPIAINPRLWRLQKPKWCTVTAFGRVYHDEESKDDMYRKNYRIQVEPCRCDFYRSQMQPKYGFQLCGVVQKHHGYGLCPGDEGSGLICDGLLAGITVKIETVKNLETCDLAPVDLKCGSRYTAQVFKQTNFIPHWINAINVLADKNNTANEGKIANCHALSSWLPLVMYHIFNLYVF